jgi:hypothetical protein
MNRVIIAVIAVFLPAACIRAPEPPAKADDTPPASSVHAKYGVYPRAIIQAGTNPLWFELTEEGPLLIASPEEAALNPFTPWPLTRHVQGILAWEERLVLGINREGFLILEGRLPSLEGRLPSGEVRDKPGIELYRIDLKAAWGNYTLGALFFYRHSPAALIYRDDYFIENTVPPPRDRFWSLGPDGTGPLEPGAFSAFPPRAGWDLETLRQGPDGFWYFRAMRKGEPGQEGYYGRTADLALNGEASSAGALQNAVLPRPVREAPEPLKAALEAAALSEGGDRSVWAAEVIAPEFEGPRSFSNRPSRAAGEVRELYGYFTSASESPRALVIAADGNGYYGEYQDGRSRLEPAALPPLPEGFVYTGAGLLGYTILGTWEERDAWNIGAAGFVLVAR